MIWSIKLLVFIEILTCTGALLFWFFASNHSRKVIGYVGPAAAIAIPAGALLLPLYWLYCGFLFLMPFFARTRIQLAGIYIIATFLAPGISAPISAGVYLLNIDTRMAIGLGCLAAILFKSLKGSKGSILFDIPCIMLFLILLITSVRDTSITNILRGMLTALLTCVPPYVIFSRSARTREDLSELVTYFLFAMTILSVILCYEAVRHWPLYPTIIDHFGLTNNILIKMRAGYLRASGPFMEPTSTAFVMSLSLTAVWLYRRAFRSSLHHIGCVTIILLGTLAPQSRAAMMGTVLGLTCAEIYRGRAGRAFAAAAIIGAGFVGALVAATSSAGLESYFTGSQTGQLEDYRLTLMSRGMEEFWKHPLFGAAGSEVYKNLSDIRQGEGIVDFVNTYLSTALFAGLIGLMFFIVAMLLPVATLASQRRVAGLDPVSRDIGAWLFGSAVAIAVMYFFTSFMGAQFYSTLLISGFTGALILILRRTRRGIPPSGSLRQQNGTPQIMVPAA